MSFSGDVSLPSAFEAIKLGTSILVSKRMKQLFRFSFPMVAALLAASQAIAASIVFPNDSSVMNLKNNYGAKGDGVANDTQALQNGLDNTMGGPSRILFIPNGVYLVTNTLVVHGSVGPWVHGESRDGVIIRLADGITNYVTNCTSVLRTHFSDTQATSADFFMRNFHNLTIDVGQNPGVDGIRWNGNNTSILKDIHVTGNGRIGINSGFIGQSGPNIIQDALIDGFETGISSQWMWGETISRVTIRNCRKEGVYVAANSVAIEDLVVENTPCAVRNDNYQPFGGWDGVTVILGGRFSGGSSSQPAITNRGVLYARNVTATGFKQALVSTTAGGSIAGTNISEYTSDTPLKLFTNSPGQSFKLPIKAEPVVPWETNLSNWVCANTYGATYGDNTDDTAAIQAAVDAAASAGKTVVYLRGIGGGDPNWYNVNGVVRVHGSVRQVIGLGFTRILGGANGRFVVDDSSAAQVKFQNFQAFGGNPCVVENRSTHCALIVESCDFKVLGTGLGDIFATDCSCRVELDSPGQSLWARQLNPEGNDDIGLVRNYGGKLWVLGIKHEGMGVRVKTDNGGQTEVFGMFNYSPDVPASDKRPMFDIDNSAFCGMGLREISFGGTFPVKVREIRDGQVKTVDGGGWIGWPMYSGWATNLTNGAVAVSWPTLQPGTGNFLSSITVTTATTTVGAQLRYTTDGSDPTSASPLYTAPLMLTNTVTLKVKGFATNLAPSATATGQFNCLTLRDPMPGLIPTNGLTYSYYEGSFNLLPNFSLLRPVKTGTVPVFDITPRLRDDNFAFLFSGYFSALIDGIYTFYTTSDDGSRLWIGNTLVVDNDGPHGMSEQSGQIALKSGQHPITVGYYNGTGGRGLTVSYDGPGIPKQPVATNLFIASASVPLEKGRTVGLEYQYFEGNWSALPDFDTLTPIKSGIINGFNFSPRRQDNHFGFRYYGWINLPSDGIWTFYTSSDDGSKLYLDGIQLVNNDGNHGMQEASGSLDVSAGYHSIIVTYFQGNGGQGLTVSFAGPGMTKWAIPSTSLVRTPPGIISFGLNDGSPALSYVRPMLGPTYSYELDYSTNLVDWLSSSGQINQPSILTVNPYQIISVSPSAAMDAQPYGFLRLRITQAAP
jgi:hypothetical protein